MHDQTLAPAAVTLPIWLDRDELSQAITMLDEELRLVLCLFFFESLTLDEIATVLDMAEDRVAELFYRAMESVGAAPAWENSVLAAA